MIQNWDVYPWLSEAAHITPAAPLIPLKSRCVLVKWSCNTNLDSHIIQTLTESSSCSISSPKIQECFLRMNKSAKYNYDCRKRLWSETGLSLSPSQWEPSIEVTWSGWTNQRRLTYSSCSNKPGPSQIQSQGRIGVQTTQWGSNWKDPQKSSDHHHPPIISRDHYRDILPSFPVSKTTRHQPAGTRGTTLTKSGHFSWELQWAWSHRVKGTKRAHWRPWTMTRSSITSASSEPFSGKSFCGFHSSRQPPAWPWWPLRSQVSDEFT